MSLEKYWQKRDFNATPEPHGKVTQSTQSLSFYIQRHHATRLHYDFRLELNGTLKSWAVPKGPSLNPKDKRLAVHVEDHPLAYGTFEGQIPKGQYGAGQVVLWDKGHWIPIGDPEKGYRDGNLKFELQGEKLAGKWALVRMKPRREESREQENWLLIKENDAAAKLGDAAAITELRPESVLELLANKAVAAPTKPAVASNKSRRAPVTGPVIQLPALISPELATLVKAAPIGDEWLSEIKFDGYRALSRIENGEVLIYTRNGNDWTRHWPHIAEAMATLPVDNAWMDGEVVAIENGKINFGALQNYDSTQKHPKIQLKYYLFDLMYLNGQDISHLPLIDRKRLLEEILSAQDTDSVLQYSRHLIGQSHQAFDIACKQGIEGIVIKHRNAPYSQSRSHHWLKLKCAHRQEFVIGGYTPPQGSRQGFGALLLGYYDATQAFIYAGRVGTGFNATLINKLAKRFKPLIQAEPAFKNPPRGYEARGVHWLKPELVAEINFAEWTTDGIVRHASFVEMREDKPASQIYREMPANTAPTQTESELTAHSPNKIRKSSADHRVAGISISHPDRLIYTPENLTKRDIADYYLSVEKWIMPHLAGRPLSLLRCPDGTQQECFFQKHLDEFKLKYVDKVSIAPHNKGKYLVVHDIAGVIELVQMGVIELHTWGSTTQHVHTPNRFIFDLDPDPAVPWEKVIEGAQLVKYLLEELGLICFLKTTGGKGLHIVTPIQPTHEFEVVKAFSKRIASHLAQNVSTHFVAVMSKEKRKNKIFIDYLRNGEEATAIAAYSLRARAGAPLSVPLYWEELGSNIKSDSFNLQNIQSRLDALQQDPWQAYYHCTQTLTQQVLDTF